VKGGQHSPHSEDASVDAFNAAFDEAIG